MGNVIILSVLYCEAFKLCLGLDDAWKATQSSAVRQEIISPTKPNGSPKAHSSKKLVLEFTLVLLEKLIALFRRPQTPKTAGIRQNRWFSKRKPKSESRSTLVLIAQVRYIKILTWPWGFNSGHFFYIWFGFLWAQLSSGNCETI